MINRFREERILVASLSDIGVVDSDGPIEIGQKYEAFYRKIGMNKRADKYAAAVVVLKGGVK